MADAYVRYIYADIKVELVKLCQKYQGTGFLRHGVYKKRLS